MNGARAEAERQLAELEQRWPFGLQVAGTVPAFSEAPQPGARQSLEGRVGG
jgi:hypothetical protein